MKKLVLFAILALSLVVSCSKFDDSAIWDKLNKHETRIAYLEEVCKKMNGDIVNLQTIVTALESNDCVIGVTPLATEDGYAITFKSGKSIVIYNGKDGQNGSNGIDGKDAVTPVVSVMKDDDGFYYWTVNGEWLIVDGQKVKASAVDGKNGSNGINGTNGTNGENGVTPKFKIENDYWYVSYDNGKNWEELGKAKGDDGLAGENGDSLFKRVFVEDGYVCFEMNDESRTVIRLPLMKDGTLTINLENEGTLSTIMSLEETRSTTSLILSGNLNVNDMRHLQIMPNLQFLNLRDAIYNATDVTINPYRDTIINKSLVEIILPKQEGRLFDFSYCLSLRKIYISGDKTSFRNISSGNLTMEFCPNVSEFEYEEGVTTYNAISYSYWKTLSSLSEVVFPSTLTEIPVEFFHYTSFTQKDYSGSVDVRTHNIACKTFICKAIQPPTAKGDMYIDSYKAYRVGSLINAIQLPKDAVLYVPAESVELYKVAPVWENFTNIQAIPVGE